MKVLILHRSCLWRKFQNTPIEQLTTTCVLTDHLAEYYQADVVIFSDDNISRVMKNVIIKTDDGLMTNDVERYLKLVSDEYQYLKLKEIIN